MLDMDAIRESIQELENGDTTYANCQKLASLYIIMDRQNKTVDTPVEDTISKAVEEELDDILPYYRKYCMVKRDFQLQKTTREAVLTMMERTCTEIQEFLHTLYTGTDMPEERSIIFDMLTTTTNELQTKRA